MRKKLLSLLLAGVMVFSLTACGGNGGSDNSGSTGNAGGNADVSETEGGSTGGDEEAGAGAADLDVGNVEELYVTWPSLGGAPADLAMIEEAVNEIVTPKLGVKAVFQSIQIADLASQQQLLISSGDKIDLVSMLFTGLDVWVNTESLLEIEDYLADYGTGIMDIYGDKIYAGSRNGHIYGVPKDFGGSPFGFLARTDILEKYGYDTADRTITVEELEEMFATVKEGEGNAFYPVAGGGSFQCMGPHYDALGGQVYTGVVLYDSDSDTIVDLYETDEFAEYAQRMYDWAQKGYISADAATTEETPQMMIATGSYFGAFAPTAQATKSSYYSSNGTVPLTSLDIVSGRTGISDLTGTMWGVASTCEIPEKAVAFLNELYINPELSDLLMFGIEGVHYEVVEENAAGQKLLAMPEGVDPMTSGYFVALGVWDMSMDAVWASDAGYRELEDKETQKGYELSAAFGYIFDNTAYSTELTALGAIFNEYSKIIDCGAIDPATELPAFIDALKAANIDEVIAGNQEQYDAWRAAQ